VASFSASAGLAVPSVTAATKAITNTHLDLIGVSFCRFELSTPGDPPGG
jgi:hypothetical protein